MASRRDEQAQGDDETPEVVRLSVNLAPEVADALKRLARKKNVSVTEMVRRAISTENFIDEQLDDNKRVLVEDRNDKSVREVVFR